MHVTRTRILCFARSCAVLAPRARPFVSRRSRRGPGPRVEISFAGAARAEPVTGMVYLAISTDNQTPADPADRSRRACRSSRHSSQDLEAGHAGDHHAREPRPSRSRACADIPAGDYWVQPFVNVYTRFPRADGHTVWLHMDQWEGQNWKRSPGNLYGDPVKMRIDPGVGRRRSSSSPTR